jgi:hypothetical protein
MMRLVSILQSDWALGAIGLVAFWCLLLATESRLAELAV